MKIFKLILFMMLFHCTLSYGQVDTTVAFSFAEIGGAGNFGGPMSYWKQVGDKTLGGYELSVGTRVSNKRFIFAGINYRDTYIGSSFMSDVLIDIDKYDINTTSKFTDISVYARYEFNQIWYLIPYLGVSSGLRVATTKSEYTLVEYPDNEDTEREHRDVSYVNTLSAGIKIPLLEQFSVCVSGQYLISTKTKYDILDEDYSAVITHPLHNFRLIETYPKHWNVGIGIIFTF